MAIIRVNKTKNYTVMCNFHLQDKRLTLKAKGLLSLMLSLPDDWSFTIKGLMSMSKDSKTAVQSALKELEVNKYLKRTRRNTKDGHFTYIYNVFEVSYEYEVTFKNKESKEEVTDEILVDDVDEADKVSMLQNLDNVDDIFDGLESVEEIETTEVVEEIKGKENKNNESDDSPRTENHVTVDSPQPGSPRTEKPCTVNRPLINTKEQNTKEQNTYLSLKKENIKRKKDLNEVLDKLEDEDLKTAFLDFIEMRKTIKKPMTARALTLSINKLFTLTSHKEEMIAIINQSVMNCWQTFYPLKVDTTYSKKQNKTSAMFDDDFAF